MRGVLIPAALGYLVLARPIVRLLLEHGDTTPTSADLVAPPTHGLAPEEQAQLEEARARGEWVAQVHGNLVRLGGFPPASG